jgi:hypothetical protein
MHPESTPALSQRNNKVTTVKTLFDHGHHKRSTMVIYDDDPRIEKVMKDALHRHQDKLKNQEDFL